MKLNTSDTFPTFDICSECIRGLDAQMRKAGAQSCKTRPFLGRLAAVGIESVSLLMKLVYPVLELVESLVKNLFLILKALFTGDWNYFKSKCLSNLMPLGLMIVGAPLRMLASVLLFPLRIADALRTPENYTARMQLFMPCTMIYV